MSVAEERMQILDQAHQGGDPVIVKTSGVKSGSMEGFLPFPSHCYDSDCVLWI